MPSTNNHTSREKINQQIERFKKPPKRRVAPDRVTRRGVGKLTHKGKGANRGKSRVRGVITGESGKDGKTVVELGCYSPASGHL